MMIMQPLLSGRTCPLRRSPGSIVLLTRLSRLVYKRATEDVLGMRLKAYVTLSNLRDGPLPQQDLCIAMHLDPNNCVLMLNDLEDAGYVERRRDPADRRRHIVEMTPAGPQGDAARPSARWSRLEDDVLGALAPEEREVLRELLGPRAGRPSRPLSALEPCELRALAAALVADLGEVVASCPGGSARRGLGVGRRRACA